MIVSWGKKKTVHKKDITSVSWRKACKRSCRFAFLFLTLLVVVRVASGFVVDKGTDTLFTFYVVCLFTFFLYF